MTFEEYLSEFTDYKPITTFWNDFSIADAFGEKAIIDTFKRAFGEWKYDYKCLTELVLVLNHKLWQHHEIPGHIRIAQVYESLWQVCSEWAEEHLTGSQLSYYFQVVD